MQVRCVGGGVSYKDGLVRDLKNNIERLMEEHESFRAFVDKDRIPVALEHLRKSRIELVSTKAATRLGFPDTQRLWPGQEEFYSGDGFESHFHPYGKVMEAAVKAALGMTTPKPEATIDEIHWARPRSFRVELPEELILIDESEMEEAVTQFAVNIQRQKGLKEFWGALAAARSEAKEIEKRMRVLVQTLARQRVQTYAIAGGEEAPKTDKGRAGAGIIKAAMIEIITDQHDPRGENVGSQKLRREEEIAESIRRAIYERVLTRLQGLNWQGEPTVSLNLASA